MIEGEPLGFLRAARAPGLLDLAKNGCFLFVLLGFLPGALAANEGDRGFGMAIVLGVLLALVAAACVSVALRVRRIARQRVRLVGRRGRLEFESTSGRRRQTEEWLYDDVDLVRLGLRWWGVDYLASPYLEIVALGRAWHIFEQYDRADLLRVEELLGQTLGLQTGSSWRPGSTERRPIPRPAKSVLSIHDESPGRLEVHVPVRGFAYGLVHGLSGLVVVVGVLGLIAAALGYGLPGENGEFTATHRGTAMFAGLFLGGWAVGRFLPPFFATKLVLRTSDAGLGLDAPLRRGRTWSREEIDRLGVDHVETLQSDSDELAPALVLWTTDGKRRVLVRHERVLGRGAAHELYWVADQLQRHLPSS